uniref:Inhibitor of Bruton tyrosine kinase n=1 Tax=Anthurium amnicola TaxID=1678845 RepID=A0A1D1XD86_9ARAE
MEGLPSPSGSFKQTPSRKVSSSNFLKDLWSVAREGSPTELDSALLLLKKNGGNIDSRNGFGLTPLHIATWRNHLPIVKKLLAAGADPDARDGESGWSSLHRALHFGHLAVAGAILQSGATLTLEDSKLRTPVDLLSGPVLLGVGKESNSVATEVFSWGSGTNYQLGTGNAHIQKLPCKVDALQGSYPKLSAAAKFHSVAVGNRGELYTWGFGRGGRLGHQDFDIHSGQAAVITPRQVTLGLGSRRVKAIAAAKHHTVIATESGEVFTWGSNREGQLGYTSVDTQPTPRRVSSLRSKIISVAAGNKHTVAVAEVGEVFTWGCNKEGQLGYGTSNSASNYTPRMVEYLKGKTFKAVSAAKYHTIVLGKDGEVFTWGHRLVNPRRVMIARNIRKSGSVPLNFHRTERLHVVAVAAGTVHSTAITDDGTLFYWVSSDPDLRCQQMYSLCGRSIVSISAGKYWTSAVTMTGDVYLWDGKKYKDETPIPTRLHGIKRAISVSVGETHLLIVCALYHPIYRSKSEVDSQKQKLEFGDETDELGEDFIFNGMQSEKEIRTIREDDFINKPIASLKSLCEKAAAEFLVEPRNAIQILEIADSLEANDLRAHCEEIAIRNLDFIFTVSAPAIASASPEILAKLEKAMDARSSESWSHRRLPTKTATFPAIINSEEEHGDEHGLLRIRESDSKSLEKLYRGPRVDTFLQSGITDSAVIRQVRALRKKLQQIEILEVKQSNGHILDDQQLAKLQSKHSLESVLTDLGFPPETELKGSLSAVPDGKGNKKMGASRKQRRKSKQKELLVEILSVKPDTCLEDISFKDFLDTKDLQLSKEVDIDMKPTNNTELKEDVSVDIPESIYNSCSNKNNTNKNPQQNQPKRKNKKGGLSMFLSGALDDTQREVPQPLTTKSEGPAWGGVKISKGATSFRDIQNEQSRIKDTQVDIRSKNKSENTNESGSAGQIRLSSPMPSLSSSPIAVASAHVVSAPEGEKNTPPWSSAGTSPVLSRPSLRDIQIQQEKKQQSVVHSPKSRISGFAVPSHQGSPSEACRPLKDAVPNRWFKPEIETPSSIRSIQIEERAMKDLKRFYSSVKLVKPPPQS